MPAKEKEKAILFENMYEQLLEFIAEYLYSQELQIDKAIAQLRDPVNMRDSELCERMAKAALDEAKKTFVDANGTCTSL